LTFINHVALTYQSFVIEISMKHQVYTSQVLLPFTSELSQINLKIYEGKFEAFFVVSHNRDGDDIV